MRRAILTTLGLILIASGGARGATFGRSSIAPDAGLDALTRGVARSLVGRQLLSDPWATATLATTDVYDVFPYVESRTFEFVSDPAWNRLVYGEAGQTLSAYDGQGQPLGPLAEPRGLAVDEQDHVYVADTGHDRVLVLQASTQYGDLTLVPLYEIRGLSHPYAVAYSDGGTPFVPGDDVLYVADTGRNRVVAFALGGSGARQLAALGDLGSGQGRFAGPMAIAAGRSDGVNTSDVYVADAHTRRLVHLRLEGGSLEWVGDVRDSADVVTSLDTDRWGNLYAAAPNRGVVTKFAPDLTPVAELRGDLVRPRGFHVPFVTVRDHRTGTTVREGRAGGVSLEEWSDTSGLRLWSLGLDVPDLAVTAGPTPGARFTLTDQAEVALELDDVSTGRVLLSRALGSLPAGVHAVDFSASDLAAANGAGDVVLRVTAASDYAGGPTATAQAAFRMANGVAALPSQAVLFGGAPNPVSTATRIAFVLPAAAPGGTALRVYDSSGRVVRAFDAAFAPGLNEVVWDLRGTAGARVAPGVYFLHLRAGARELTQRLVVVR